MYPAIAMKSVIEPVPSSSNSSRELSTIKSILPASDKRGPGRPRKVSNGEVKQSQKKPKLKSTSSCTDLARKRGRGRPRKAEAERIFCVKVCEGNNQGTLGLGTPKAGSETAKTDLGSGRFTSKTPVKIGSGSNLRASSSTPKTDATVKTSAVQNGGERNHLTPNKAKKGESSASLSISNGVVLVRKRGRPRKDDSNVYAQKKIKISITDSNGVQRKRGRPRKARAIEAELWQGFVIFVSSKASGSPQKETSVDSEVTTGENNDVGEEETTQDSYHTCE